MFLIWKSTDGTQTVVIDSASEDDHDVIPVKTKTLVKPKSVQNPVAATLDVKPILKPKPKPRSANLNVPKAKVKCTSPAADISQSSSDLNTLPEFARSAWSTSLPTLYSCLGCSPTPFVIHVDPTKGTQEVVDVVYPDSDYQVICNDRIFTLVGLLSFHCISTDELASRQGIVSMTKGPSSAE